MKHMLVKSKMEFILPQVFWDRFHVNNLVEFHRVVFFLYYKCSPRFYWKIMDLPQGISACLKPPPVDYQSCSVCWGVLYRGFRGKNAPTISNETPPTERRPELWFRSWGSWWTEGQMGNVWVPTDPEMKRMVEFSAGNFAGNFCWEFLMKCWWFVRKLSIKICLKKNQSDLEGNYVSEIFLSYNGSAVFFEGMVPVGSLELLLKKNIWQDWWRTT